MTWMAVNLFFLPQLNLRLELVLHFFTEIHITLAGTLFAMFGIFAVLLNQQLYATISISIQALAIPVIVGFAAVDVFNSSRYDELANQTVAKLTIYLFRIVALACQCGSTFVLWKLYPQLSDEKQTYFEVIRTEFNVLRSLLPRVGRANFAVLVASLFLLLSSLLTIVFRISGTNEYPQAYIMFYLLVLGQPAAFCGALTDTALLLVLTLALDLTPTLMWMTYTAYGGIYWVFFLWELMRLAFVLWAMVGSGIRHWRQQRASPAERGLATTEFGDPDDAVTELEMEPSAQSSPYSSPHKRSAMSMPDPGDEELELEATVSDGDEDVLPNIDENDSDSDRI